MLHILSPIAIARILTGSFRALLALLPLLHNVVHYHDHRHVALVRILSHFDFLFGKLLLGINLSLVSMSLLRGFRNRLQSKLLSASDVAIVIVDLVSTLHVASIACSMLAHIVLVVLRLVLQGNLLMRPYKLVLLIEHGSLHSSHRDGSVHIGLVGITDMLLLHGLLILRHILHHQLAYIV